MAGEVNASKEALQKQGFFLPTISGRGNESKSVRLLDQGECKNATTIKEKKRTPFVLPFPISGWVQLLLYNRGLDEQGQAGQGRQSQHVG